MKPQEYIEALNAGATVLLPSGLEVRVRPIDSRVLLNQQYSSDLMAIIHEKLLGELPSMDSSKMSMGELVEVNNRTMLFYKEVARNCVIEPKLVEKTVDEIGEGEFPIDLIPQNDLIFFASLINLPLVELKPFCAEQTERVERILRGESQPVQPVTAAWDGADGTQPDGGETIPADQYLVDVLSPG